MYITTAKVNQWLHSLHTSHKREKMCYLPRGFGQVIIQNKFQMNIVECSSRSALRAAASSQCCQLHVSRMSSLEAPQLVERRRRFVFRWKRSVAGSRAQTPLRFRLRLCRTSQWQVLNSKSYTRYFSAGPSPKFSSGSCTIRLTFVKHVVSVVQVFGFESAHGVGPRT